MDNLLEALAKGMNVSIDGISSLLGSNCFHFTRDKLV